MKSKRSWEGVKLGLLANLQTLKSWRPGFAGNLWRALKSGRDRNLVRGKIWQRGEPERQRGEKVNGFAEYDDNRTHDLKP